MPGVQKPQGGPKASAFGQLCVLCVGTGLVASLVVKSLWPLIVFGAVVYLVLLFTNRFERQEIQREDETAGETGRRPRK